MLVELPKRLTIFTPTYNRGYCLGNCYESLKKQTCHDFRWLIIDDGSTDQTDKLVRSWMEEGIVDIRYVYQENQGMHGAHNTAYHLIDTELNVCIDSDDYMPIDAVEKIIMFWSKYGGDHVGGIIGLDAYLDGTIIGTRLPEDLKQSTLFHLYHKHGVKGDKKLVYRTCLTRKYPYPVFQGERYVGLDYKYYKLDCEYEMLLLNEVICLVEYLADGSSLNMLSQYRRNPKGFAFYRIELMKLPMAGGLFKFRQAIHYVSSSLLEGNKQFLRDTPEKWLTWFALLPGILLYTYILRKTAS